MAESLDVPTWKSRVTDWWQDAAGDLGGTMRRLGVRTAYGLLTASAFLPLLETYSPENPGPAISALSILTAGVGSNLVANLVQGAYDKATAPRRAEQEVAERPDLRAEYQQLLGQLDVLHAAQSALGEQWSAFEARLQQELVARGVELHIIDSGGGAIVFGSVRIEHGDFVGHDKHEHHYHAAPPPPDLTPLREAYLRQLVSRAERLPLRGVDVGAGDPSRGQRLRLAHVYVDVDTTAPRRMRRDALPRLLAEQRARDVDERGVLEAMTGPEGSEALSALEVTVGNRRLVITGDPGSGKSTFVNHLALCLATAQLGPEPESTLFQHLPGWPEAEADLLPVIVVLRDFARWATAQEKAQGDAHTLCRFLERWLTDRDLAAFVAPLRQALHDGQAIVFFDGLDEIGAREQRALVRAAVEDFGRTYDGARIVVTCRTLPYQDRTWQLPADRFPAFELAPLDEEKIDRFIRAWYHELAALGAVRPEDVDTLADKLRAAVRRPDIRRLATNPLLLTVMALVHAYKGRLPEVRALLYEECTDLLLWRWEEVKVQAQPQRAAGLRALLVEAGLQDVDLKRALWALAFEAHASESDHDAESDEATADIPETDLLRALRELHPGGSWDWTAAVVRQIQERAGLLIEREPEIYTFPHRTFQEYLAACHLSVQAEFPGQAARLSDEAAFWREAVLLAVGRQVHVSGNVAQPLALVAELCPGTCGAGDTGWRRAWLAGEVLHEAGENRVRQYGALGRELLDRVQDRLAVLVEGGHLSARERAEVGDLLGRLGDPRFDPDRYFLPRCYRGEPEPFHGFVEIPAGPFAMGSREGDKETDGDEVGNPETLTIPYRYWMARYPVTVAQYSCFVDAGGYEDVAWWTGTGWAWRKGEWNSQVEDDTYKRWLALRPAELRGAPMWWDGQLSVSNHPVTGVSWFEAVAYGNWLSARLHDVLPGGYAARLPTEAEWEKAARSGHLPPAGRGKEARRYPWGNDDWDEGRANIENRIGHANPVGIYPRGATPTELHEMSGNVWEWTASLYRPYPYRPDDGRNDPEGEGSRVLRGGFWVAVQGDARCAYRVRFIPVDYDSDVGFRVVVFLVFGNAEF